jgi:hypothetical protein
MAEFLKATPTTISQMRRGARPNLTAAVSPYLSFGIKLIYNHYSERTVARVARPARTRVSVQTTLYEKRPDAVLASVTAKVPYL